MSKISEITRASNVASTDLILVTGNVGSTETSYAVEWKNCNDWYQQTVTVAKDGGQYSNIQSAIDSITDASASKKYAILLYPGIYTENVVLKSYISIKGMAGNKRGVEITNSSGNVIELPITGNSGLSTLRIQATGTAKTLYINTGSTTKYNIFDCSFHYNQDGGYTDMVYLNSGITYFSNCTFEYVSTGTTTGVNYHRVIYIDGTASYHIHGCHIDGSIQDVDDTLDLIEESSSSAFSVIQSSGMEAYGTASVRAFDVETAGANRNIENNHIRLSGNSAGTGITFKMDDVLSEVHSVGNRLIVENFTVNEFANVAGDATLFSHFDDINADNGSGGDGTIILASSTFDGSISMTNNAIQVYDAAGGVDCNTVAGLAIPWNTQTIKDDMYTHSTTVNPSRVYVTRTGLYECTYGINWLAGANNVDVSCYLRIDGTTEPAATRSSAGQARASVEGSNKATFFVQLTAGSYIQIMATRGGAVTTASNTVANRSWILIKLLRGNI